MPKSVKLIDDHGKELRGVIRKAGTEVHPKLIISFDTESEAREFIYTVRNDPIKLAKVIVDLFSQKELLASYEPRHKPKVVVPETSASSESSEDKKRNVEGGE